MNTVLLDEWRCLVGLTVLGLNERLDRQLCICLLPTEGWHRSARGSIFFRTRRLCTSSLAQKDLEMKSRLFASCGSVPNQKNQKGQKASFGQASLANGSPDSMGTPRCLQPATWHQQCRFPAAVPLSYTPESARVP